MWMAWNDALRIKCLAFLIRQGNRAKAFDKRVESISQVLRLTHTEDDTLAILIFSIQQPTDQDIWLAKPVLDFMFHVS